MAMALSYIYSVSNHMQPKADQKKKTEKKTEKNPYISFRGLCEIGHKGTTNCNDYIFSGQCFSSNTENSRRNLKAEINFHITDDGVLFELIGMNWCNWKSFCLNSSIKTQPITL